MSKILKAWSLAYGRSLVVALIATAIVVSLGCLLVLVPLGLVIRADLDLWVLIVSASLFFLILNGGSLGILVWMLRRRKRRLDAAFTPLGLDGERYMLTGRQYRGTLDGRQAKVLFYRGPMLEMGVETPLQTRLGVAEVGSTTPALARLFGLEPLDIDEPTLSEYRVYALDGSWAHSLLGKADVRNMIDQLLNGGGSWALVKQVVLAPGSLRLRLYRNKHLFKYTITPEDAQQWFDDLLALASAAEALSAPTITDEESTAERPVHTGDTSRIALTVVALLVGVPTCVLAVAAAAFFVWAIQ
jgi:hypothetical protein